MILVFTGIQGCGKGTQARILAKKYNFTVIEMGQEFRNIIASGSQLGKEINDIFQAGHLMPDEITGEVMKEVIGRQTNSDLILDGFIRSLGNKISLEKIVPNYKVVFLNLSKEKAINRLLGRMFDLETGESFPPGTEINPNNGNKLIRRKDDIEEAILKRFDEFEKKTLPVVEIDRIEGRVIDINADQSPEEVTKEIEKKLGLS